MIDFTTISFIDKDVKFENLSAINAELESKNQMLKYGLIILFIVLGISFNVITKIEAEKPNKQE
jgi:hypothetical protein